MPIYCLGLLSKEIKPGNLNFSLTPKTVSESKWDRKGNKVEERKCRGGSKINNVIGKRTRTHTKIFIPPRRYRHPALA